MTESTDSVYKEEIYQILSHPRYTDVIDALRPTSTYTIDVSDDKLLDIYLETGKAFLGFLFEAVIHVLSDKRGSNVQRTFRNLKIELTGTSRVTMHEVSSREYEGKTVTFDATIIAADTPKTYVKRGTAVCVLCG